MRILLTGGARFIGSHVAGRLLERCHEVAVVDDLSTGKRGNVPDGAEFYETDVRNGCTRIFEEFAPEALCHQAAQMDVRRSVREPDFDAEVNVLGTACLLENCTRHGVGKETNVNRLYELLQDISGKNLPPRNGPAKLGEQLRSSVDPSRTRRVFGWRPEMSLADGLGETLRYFGALCGLEN
jgi:nucleoside-diphosphate-sugar epimerase